MTTIAPVKFYVSNGPSADRVIDALKYSFVPGCRLTVTFEGLHSSRPRRDPSYEFVAQITGVRYENGTEGSFILEGKNLTAGGGFRGFYDAKTRRGTLEMNK